MILKEFPGKDDKQLLAQIESIFQPKFLHLISIFDLNSSKKADDLDEAVLKCFLKANEPYKMANLCLSWNRVDIAKNFIFNGNRSIDVNHHKMIA
jgi:hypothetical protein